jgi:2-polyprenyl-6-hydroxyphenyl methylase/3-demethylubiquinone-9 3-methyltransferase
MGHAEDVRRGGRFEFGENWVHFLSVLDDARIERSEQALQDMLGRDALAGTTFLDVGSGSGLSSLAARRLGARVRSFDYDPQSVACTEELKRRYLPESPEWRVEEGSALDREYLVALGQHDIVYSWGVLHHTGQMWSALANVAPLVKPCGALFIAIYNDQGWVSRYWLAVKKAYNVNVMGRIVVTVLHLPYLYLFRYFVRAATGRLQLERGMSIWYDMIDWLGGLPFEVATPEQIFDFYRDRGFILERLRTCRGRMGCNEFVFRKTGAPGVGSIAP